MKSATVKKSVKKVVKLDDALVALRNSVESMDAAKTERIGSPSVNDVVRQGDVYIINIEKLPEGKPTTQMQLVPGSSQGSRHILQGNVRLVKEVQFRDINSVLLGPAFECIGEVSVTHPEHGDKILPAGTCWQVVYQQAYADVVRRAQD